VVFACEARRPVHQHHHDVGFGDGQLDLAARQARELVAARDEPAGVNDDGRRMRRGSESVDAVARQARIIGDEGVACAGEPVEQRGLADIGPSDEGEDGQQGGYSRGFVASR
jgi:hypothetical protein